MSEVWLKDYGDPFLKRIVEFCSNNGDIQMDLSRVVTKLIGEKLVNVCTLLMLLLLYVCTMILSNFDMFVE